MCRISRNLNSFALFRILTSNCLCDCHHAHDNGVRREKEVAWEAPVGGWPVAPPIEHPFLESNKFEVHAIYGRKNGTRGDHLCEGVSFLNQDCVRLWPASSNIFAKLPRETFLPQHENRKFFTCCNPSVSIRAWSLDAIFWICCVPDACHIMGS